MSLTLLDGAVGTLLGARGLATRGPLFSGVALLDERGRRALARVHREYLEAGADVLTAATFRTNARAVARVGGDARFPRLSEEAVRIAREVAGGRAQIAASIAPLEDCYLPQLAPPRAVALREHGEHARACSGAGCDLLLVETVAAREEGLAAVEACAATGLPVWVAAMVAPIGGRREPALLDGTDLASFFRAARDAGASRALVNCTPCDGIDAALPALAASGLPFGAYAHMGEVDAAVSWPSTEPLSPEEYRARAVAWVRRGASLLGGCCGTTPAHIAALHALRNLAGTWERP